MKWLVVLAPLLAACCLLVTGPAHAAGGASVSIVGGSKTTIKQWPWQVAFLKAKSRAPGKTPKERLICGGTLIAPTMIVTAGHCALDIDLSKPEYYSVVAGRTHLNNTGAGVEVLASDAFFPLTRSGVPRYLFLLDSRWDLALVELTEPVNLTPIKLPGPDEHDLLTPGRTVFKTGWGVTDPDADEPDVSNALMQSKTAIQPVKNCANTQDSGLFFPFDEDSQLCIGDPDSDSGPCYGDSGGPAVVHSSDGFRLIGATSYGTSSGCRPDEASTDAALAQPDVRDWIAGVVTAETGTNPIGSGATAGALPEYCHVALLEDLKVRKAKAKIRAGGCKVGKIRYLRIPHRARLRKYNRKVFEADPGAYWLKKPGTRVNMLVAKWFPKRHRKRN